MKKWKLKGDAIIKNIDIVLKTRDIEKLSNTAYEFVRNISGFIAHYDINGFKCEYSNVDDLERGIRESIDTREPNRYIDKGYFSECEQSEYYAEKSRILNHFKNATN